MAMTETVQKLCVDGEWYETGETLDVTSPYDGSVVGVVAYGGADDARRAVDAAERAMQSRCRRTRAPSILDGVAALLRERRDEFARTIAQEAGKPITTAGDRGRPGRADDDLLGAGGAAPDRRDGGDGRAPRRRGQGRPDPAPADRRGGAISPFNFPLNLVCHKVGPAFAAGCAVVLKPAGATPLSALLLARAFADAGQPAGWLNVIVVGRSSEIGDVLTDDERVKMITFTGSSQVGWGIRQRANKKKVSLELGNSTPLIVMADADLDKAATAIAADGYAFAGQSCISVQRVYVEDSAHDELIEKLVPKIEALKVGDPLDPDTQVGPVIDHENRDRIKSWVDPAVADGAKLLAGGEVGDDGVLRPTLLDEVALEMDVACHEVFGPVVVVARDQRARPGDRARQRHRVRPAGGHLHAGHHARRCARPGSSTSAASPSTRRPRSAPTRCPTAASRSRATPARARSSRCRR